MYLRRLIVLAATVTGSLSAAATSQAAVPICEGVGATKTLYSDQGLLESIAFDRQGRMLFSDLIRRGLFRVESPGAEPKLIAKVEWPGGIVVLANGDILVGSGNSGGGLVAEWNPSAKLLKVDAQTGQVSDYATGLSMANGVVRAKNNTIYASNGLAPSLDKINPDGKVERGWYKGSDTNGLALSRNAKTLYASQTHAGQEIIAIDTSTRKQRTVVKFPLSFLDDLEMDRAENLYVNAFLPGAVWRAKQDGTYCSLTDSVPMTAGMSLGRAGSGFSSSSVYVSTYQGKIVEIPGAVPKRQLSVEMSGNGRRSAK